MADINVKVLPVQLVGPTSTFQVLPRLSLRPPMLTGKPSQDGCAETNATSIEALVELTAPVVCVASGVPLMYPWRLTTAGEEVCASAGTAASARTNTSRAPR